MSVKLDNETDRFSYALAMNISASVLHIPIKMNRELMIDTFAELLRGGKPQLEQKEYVAIMQAFQEKLQSVESEKAESAGKQNLEEGKAFLAENGKKDGVKTTASGLQYEILIEGKGKMPKATDMVKVHYEGKLLDGSIFDSSIQRGEPAEFPLNRVIAGWTEGLQLMKEGSKFRFYIPSELAYGTHGAGGMIGPNATLIFDVELLAVK